MRPTRSPKLSQFCINLTGIRQDVVDRQQSFPTVYLKLADWIQRIELEYSLRFASPSQRNADFNGINATFCSWSDTDLKSYFKSECRRLNISALSYFKTWIDVRQSFNVSEPEQQVANTISQNTLFWIKKNCGLFYLQRAYALGRCKFSEALQYAGISTVGQAHSAMHDAENLAKLVVHLTKRGAQFKATTNYCDHNSPVDFSYWHFQTNHRKGATLKRFTSKYHFLLFFQVKQITP